MLAAEFEAVGPHPDERRRLRRLLRLRLLLPGAQARALGHGGIGLLARAAGVREATVSPALLSWTAERNRRAGRGALAGAQARGRRGSGAAPGAAGPGGAGGTRRSDAAAAVDR
jgi:hypothetical protein